MMEMRKVRTVTKPGDPILRDALVAAGLKVVQIDGWQTRGRPWDAEFKPKYILSHHTASLAAATSDVTYIVMGNATAPGPICQLYLSRGADPTWYIIAAGGGNHAGSGTWPDGTSGNKFAYGIEAANAGGLWIEASKLATYEARAASLGADITFTPARNSAGVAGYRMNERWHDNMVDAYAKGIAALLRAFGWGIDRVCTHASYTGNGRKVDPSGVTKFWPNTTTWDLNVWRSFINSFNTTPVPTPVPAPPAPPTPGPTPTPTTTYTVQPGDSWWAIAVKVYGNGSRWTDIANLNGGPTRVIRPGDVLTLPNNGIVPAPPTPPTPPPPPPTPPPPPPLQPPLDQTAAIEAQLPVVRPGEQGIHVKRVQCILKALGFEPGAIDGFYGTSTTSPTRLAIMAFQQSMQISQDGVVGRAQTWPALLGTSGTTPLVEVRPGSSGRPVQVVQGLLLANGFDPGATDGKYGKSANSPTRRAIVAFQNTKDINQDGIVGLSQTWPHLLGVG